jgi:hypothetical protein
MMEIPEVQGIDFTGMNSMVNEMSHQAHVSQLEGVAWLGFFALVRSFFSGGIQLRYGNR